VPIFDLLDETPAGLPQLMVEAQLAASTSEARRLVEQGAIMVADRPVTDWRAKFSVADLDAAGELKIARGKKKVVRLRRRG
jgi:tyrosyl-tRNA synthetase